MTREKAITSLVLGAGLVGLLLASGLKVGDWQLWALLVWAQAFQFLGAMD